MFLSFLVLNHSLRMRVRACGVVGGRLKTLTYYFTTVCVG